MTRTTTVARRVTLRTVGWRSPRRRWRALARASRGPHPAVEPSGRAPRPPLSWVAHQPIWLGAGGTALAGCAGWGVGGAVAAVAAAGYAGAVGVAIVRRGRARARREVRARAVAAVASLAADLRAGLDVSAATAAVARDLSREPVVAGRTGAAVALAEATGAPLADLLDQLDEDLRMVDRARANAQAQAAGARASALMLAAMPAVGVGLGHAIGADPARVLFHTRLGATCLFLSLVLQAAGLIWASRLAQIEVTP